MKIGYFITSIIMILAAFALGYITGQQTTPNEVTSLNDISATRTSLDKLATIEAKSNCRAILSSNVSRTMEDIVAEIETLVVSIEENPNQKSLAVKLYVILEALSAEELIELMPLLKNINDSQSKMLSQTITSLLIEKSPEKALAFAQRYNPMPDSPYYFTLIKAQIAEKIPELGFEYLNEFLGLDPKDIDLNKNANLITVLAKADLKQLIDTLIKFQAVGVKIDDSLHGVTYGLKTNEEYLSVFNELTRLNDIPALSTVIYHWIGISPTEVFERLNEIEDAAERKILSDRAFHFWMMKNPEAAAEEHLASALNKNKALKNIIRLWPDKKASDALNWISAQSDIDINRYKIDYLKDLSRSDPKFVESHVNDINLNDDEKIDFYQNLYNGFKSKSSADAEAFVNTLPFKDEVLANTAEKITSADPIAEINKAFRKYYAFKYDKAFALAIGDNGVFAYSYIVNRRSQSEANEKALSRCEQRRHKKNIPTQCKIYAEGDVILFNIAP